MVKLISKSNAKKLIEELFSKAHPMQNKFKSSFLKHSEVTFKIAMETTVDIINHNSDLQIDPCEVAIAGYFHDIGRPLSVNQTFHEIRGALYIKNRGHKEGIAGNKGELERLPMMILPHFIAYEEYQDKNYPLREDFSSIKASLLLPRSIEQKIIVYSDLSNLDGKEMNFRERLEHIKNMRRDDFKFMHAFERGEPRINKVGEEIERLLKGR